MGGKSRKNIPTFYHILPLLLKTFSQGRFSAKNDSGKKSLNLFVNRYFECRETQNFYLFLFLAINNCSDKKTKWYFCRRNRNRMEKKSDKKFIDLENIIRSKNPKLLKMLPRFVLNKIKKIIHENDVNDFIKNHGHNYDFDFANAIIREFRVNVIVKGIEHVPEKGGVIMASNHPLGGFDAMVLLHAISNKRMDVKFLVNDILLQLENLKNLFIGVNKHGKNSSDFIRDIDKLYSSDKGIFVFPAGLVSRKQNGVIKDLEWKKSFVSKAKQHNKNIVPVFIDGKNSGRFYNLALWRKKLGVKTNIEMLFLVDELYRQQGKTITIIFGKALPHQIFDSQFTDQEWAQKIKEHAYSLSSGDLNKRIAE